MKLNPRPYHCSACPKACWTRYGFRAHMLAVHGYRSTAHCRPGRGYGKGSPRLAVKQHASWLLRRLSGVAL